MNAVDKIKMKRDALLPYENYSDAIKASIAAFNDCIEILESVNNTDTTNDYNNAIDDFTDVINNWMSGTLRLPYYKSDVISFGLDLKKARENVDG